MDQDEIIDWRIEAYGTVLRGDETTSEDQVAVAVSPAVAKRLAACWNACEGLSTTDLMLGNFEIKAA